MKDIFGSENLLLNVGGRRSMKSTNNKEKSIPPVKASSCMNPLDAAAAAACAHHIT